MPFNIAVRVGGGSPETFLIHFALSYSPRLDTLSRGAARSQFSKLYISSLAIGKTVSRFLALLSHQLLYRSLCFF